MPAASKTCMTLIACGPSFLVPAFTLVKALLLCQEKGTTPARRMRRRMSVPESDYVEKLLDNWVRALR